MMDAWRIQDAHGEWMMLDHWVEGAERVPDFFSGEQLRLAKNRIWREAKAKRAAMRDAGVETPHGIIDSDAQSQQAVHQLAMTAKLADEEFETSFTLADNTVVMLTAQDLIEVSVALSRHVAAVHEAFQAVRSQIDDATSLERLQEIDVDAVTLSAIQRSEAP